MLSWVSNRQIYLIYTLDLLDRHIYIQDLYVFRYP